MTRTVVDDIGLVVDEVRALNGGLVPYYDFGHRKEIANKLLARDKDKMHTYQRYPLIALRLPFGQDKEDGIIKLNLNIGIFMFTDRNYDAKKRNELIFKPILYPLYDLFLQSLKDSGLFFWDGHLEIPKHTQIDRMYWGVEEREGNVKNIFNDPIDAIEILNLRINTTHYQLC